MEHKQLRVVVLASAALLLPTVFLISPWWSLASFAEALREQDKQRLSLYVDFPRVRESISAQLKAKLTASLEGEIDDLADAEYLQGKATSLGGLRPKCTVLEEDGALALGKLPSVQDERSVVRSEVLALKLVAHAGCRAAAARTIEIEGTEIAVIRRFDRTYDGGRIPYLSGGSLLQARRDEDRAYTELADTIRRVSPAPTEDLEELWRRLVVNLLITNVDDHLWNVGFLHVGEGKWRLAPAFDANPFPDKARESNTWLSEASGPITSLGQLLAEACGARAASADARCKVRRSAAIIIPAHALRSCSFARNRCALPATPLAPAAPKGSPLQQDGTITGMTGGGTS